LVSNFLFLATVDWTGASISMKQHHNYTSIVTRR
jgi:hypothetical protein